jgi:hypothetical protein
MIYYSWFMVHGSVTQRAGDEIGGGDGLGHRLIVARVYSMLQVWGGVDQRRCASAIKGLGFSG